MIRKQKIAKVARLQGELLREHQTGHPDWYAEMLVCAHVDGQLASTNNPKYDLQCERYGKIQVKCRVDGTDGNQNRTNFGKYQPNDFDFAAVLILNRDYTVRGARLIPQADVLSLVRASGHVRWSDIEISTRSLCIRRALMCISGESDGNECPNQIEHRRPTPHK
ncbi:MAG: hypothetical protein J5I92_10745 [Thiogranum sp.]|nr:hypothetical protein [Thiogranum sp.]